MLTKTPLGPWPRGAVYVTCARDPGDLAGVPVPVAAPHLADKPLGLEVLAEGDVLGRNAARGDEHDELRHPWAAAAEDHAVGGPAHSVRYRVGMGGSGEAILIDVPGKGKGAHARDALAQQTRINPRLSTRPEH
jgi:hypothetical protein